MGKKVYKMTEDQVASVLNSKKEGTISDIPAPGLQLSGEDKVKKTKYKITEDQLKRIFNELGKKAIDEMDNYNYPWGSDTPDAPWNQGDGKVKSGDAVGGNYVGISTDRGELLLKDKQRNKLFYTLNDVWYDIYETLEDYLDIPQEEEEDEDGKYLTNMQDWQQTISNDELLDALSSYMNYESKRGELKIANDVPTWEDGELEFLVVTPETVEAIGSSSLKEKAKQLLGSN